MASNKYLLFVLITVLCLIIPSSLRAQTSGYYMELRYVQRLTWTGDEYALRYEVVIEKEENRRYRRVLQEFTTAFFIEVSLSAGKYRYQVIPYDYLDQPVPVKEWMNFEVQRGVTPDQYDRFIPGDHEIIIVNPNDPEKRREIKLTSPKPENEKKIESTDLKPESANEIFITNSAIENIKTFDIYAGLAWLPLLPVHGENDLYGENMSFLGACLRLGIVSALRNFLSFGAEANFSYRVYTGGEPVQAETFVFNFLAQYRFRGGRAALNSRLGGGIALRPDANIGLYAPIVNMGLSFLWLPMKHLYLEAGIEYAQFFSNDYFGSFSPTIGAGYRF